MSKFKSEKNERTYGSGENAPRNLDARECSLPNLNNSGCFLREKVETRRGRCLLDLNSERRLKRKKNKSIGRSWREKCVHVRFLFDQRNPFSSTVASSFASCTDQRKGARRYPWNLIVKHSGSALEPSLLAERKSDERFPFDSRRLSDRGEAREAWIWGIKPLEKSYLRQGTGKEHSKAIKSIKLNPRVPKTPSI